MKRTPALALSSLALFIATSGYADSLTGRALDPDDKAIPGASLRLFDRNTGEVRSTTASSSGIYSFQSIPSGDYLLEGNARALLNGSSQIPVSRDQR